MAAPMRNFLTIWCEYKEHDLFSVDSGTGCWYSNHNTDKQRGSGMKKLPSKLTSAEGRGRKHKQWAGVSKGSNRGVIANGGWQPGEGKVSDLTRGEHLYLNGMAPCFGDSKGIQQGWKKAYEADQKFVEQLQAAGKNADGAIDRLIAAKVALQQRHLDDEAA